MAASFDSGRGDNLRWRLCASGVVCAAAFPALSGPNNGASGSRVRVGMFASTGRSAFTCISSFGFAWMYFTFDRSAKYAVRSRWMPNGIGELGLSTI